MIACISALRVFDGRVVQVAAASEPEMLGSKCGAGRVCRVKYGMGGAA